MPNDEYRGYDDEQTNEHLGDGDVPTGAMPIEIDGQPWTATPVEIGDEDTTADAAELQETARQRATQNGPFLS